MILGIERAIRTHVHRPVTPLRSQEKSTIGSQLSSLMAMRKRLLAVEAARLEHSIVASQTAQETVTMAMALTLGEDAEGFSVRLGVLAPWLRSGYSVLGLNCGQRKSWVLV